MLWLTQVYHLAGSSCAQGWCCRALDANGRLAVTWGRAFMSNMFLSRLWLPFYDCSWHWGLVQATSTLFAWRLGGRGGSFQHMQQILYPRWHPFSCGCIFVFFKTYLLWLHFCFFSKHTFWSVIFFLSTDSMVAFPRPGNASPQTFLCSSTPTTSNWNQACKVLLWFSPTLSSFPFQEASWKPWGNKPLNTADALSTLAFGRPPCAWLATGKGADFAWAALLLFTAELISIVLEPGKMLWYAKNWTDMAWKA